MMVTLVSQCEKKALRKTRRVLDAFANRIGDNTWQTVITQEGLLAVKKLLRKTASKNTAVSCHWIRSRARSDLVWVVGDKSKFSVNGIVPVNFTAKEVPMDIVTDKPRKGVDYANTHLQRLDYHLYAVGFIAQYLYLSFYPDKKQNAKAAFFAGCLHDIGKLDPSFQNWVTKLKNRAYFAEDGQHIDEAKFSFDKHPRHNEISVLVYELLDDVSLKTIDSQNKKSIRHAIYWHHAKPFRQKGGFETYADIYKKLDKALKGEAWSQVIEKSLEVLARIGKIDCRYRGIESSHLEKIYPKKIDADKLNYIESKLLPKYKMYGLSEEIADYKEESKFNATNNEIRSFLITADRWVSSMSAQELVSAIDEKTLAEFADNQLESEVIIESNLESEIVACISKFSNSERSEKQTLVANALVENSNHVSVLAGAAGCGKTKIALDWARLGKSQQILWICPRVQICQGLFAELASDVYLPTTNIELYTGEFKCTNTYQNITPELDYFTGDIVITTIDQVLSMVISHTKADRLLNYLTAHVVFDEYHEYINMPAFNLLFAELVASKQSLGGSTKTLLVSATPHYAYLENILDLDAEYDVEEMPSFNQSRYKFEFCVFCEKDHNDKNPLYHKQKINSFVISNTATTAQKSFILNQHNENAILLHSKYKKSDKKKLFERVFESFRRDGNKQYKILRSGPIVQASLNISCDYMVSEITTAENNLQRLGRLDRFGENEHTNQYVIAVPDSFHNGKNSGATARFLNSTSSLAATRAWYNYLQEVSDLGEKIFLLADIYHIYKDFYSLGSPAYKEIVSDLLKAMKESVNLITAKVSEPQVIARSKKSAAQRKKISKNSLRGDNRFIQMAICDVSLVYSPQVLDQYAYDIPTSESVDVDNITGSLRRLISDGLLSYAAQKHGRIDETSIIKDIPANRMKVRETLLEGYARDPEYPIFVSYTPSELDQKLGEHTAHDEAIYYGVCEKQPIGSISMKQLLNPEE